MPKHRMLVGAVSLNLRHFTNIFLYSLYRSGQQLDCESLIVDNGSTEDILSLKSDYKETSFIRFNEHKGVSPAWNFILKYGIEKEFDYICISNNDIFLNANFVKLMMDFGESHPEAGMFSPWIQDSRCDENLKVQHRYDGIRNFYADESELFQSLGYVYEPWRSGKDKSSTEGFDNFCSLMYDKYSKEILPQVLGSCFILRRQTIEDVGYFEEAFTEGQEKIGVSEDFVMSKKLRTYQEEKWKQVMNKNCPVFHWSSQTRKNNAIMKQFLNTDGESWEARRHQLTQQLEGSDLKPK